MSLVDLEFKYSYNSPKDNIVNEFLIPALREAKYYDRAVGFFSSSSLLELSVGLKEFVRKKGKMRLICSPKLSEEDIQAIQKGYLSREEKNKKLEKALVNSFKEPENSFQRERYNILAHLIEEEILDIKIAILPEAPDMAMFHSKIGIFEDEECNYVAFSGSQNDSLNAYRYNNETIDVFTSMKGDHIRAFEKKEIFEQYWNNQEEKLDIIPFPKDLKAKIESYKKEKIDWEIDKKEFVDSENIIKRKKGPIIPEDIHLRPYQQQAIEKWKENSYCGIFDMATGTGKTLTALGALTEIVNDKKRIAVIIVVPYIHLVDQWCEDLNSFKIDYIAGYSESKNKKWKEQFEKSIFRFNFKIKDNLFFITTNATFRTKFIQSLISGINGEILLIVDEAHNFGSKNLLKTLDDRFIYRLALSATLDRHFDEEGTDFLKNYFGKICIHYDLKRAIDEGMLTPYMYYPIPVYLTEEELSKYTEITEQLKKFLVIDAKGKPKYSKSAEMLLIKRSRLIAGAINKLDALQKIIEPIKNDNHILVYCGATALNKKEDDFELGTENEIRQINKVEQILSNEFNMHICQYTSQENAKEREIIKKEFDDGDFIQALVAIRCLDEGVNIPSIDKAIILASSTNPKEYIQRRGRVLRKFPGKNYAQIFDLITLPRDINSMKGISETSGELSLVRREVSRIKEFKDLALNSSESDELIDLLERAYGYINVDYSGGD
ncbi:DEAD/DEAH box helicase family protein [uncultured Dubosiella sp.]|uniref:DEAD/DEAH box helicase family protein n=1 Tax=uncultured Dubosiella sp. TaxID=1937011 RepID=UPI00262FE09E|nr:DEAD/DEAH box helicase family protein [uncultured Dubosiella sp.]